MQTVGNADPAGRAGCRCVYLLRYCAKKGGCLPPYRAARSPPEDICDPKTREGQRTLSVASPIIARMRLMIQKRMTI